MERMSRCDKRDNRRRIDMTKQEAFNKVFDWLTRDGASRCTNKHGGCAYIREDGNRCAIGALLSEETLSLMGGYELGVQEILDQSRCWPAHDHGPDLVREDLGEELATGYPAFLEHLQDLHDDNHNWHSPEAMRDALIQSAWDNSLTCPDPEEGTPRGTTR